MNRLWSLLGQMAHWLGWPLSYLLLSGSTRTRVLICCGNEALVIKNWYGGQHWSLPGGGIKRSESPLQSALRETTEEVGILLQPSQLTALGRFNYRYHGLPFNCELFTVRCQQKPAVTTRPIEVLQAAWLPIDQLARENCEPDVRYALSRLG